MTHGLALDLKELSTEDLDATIAILDMYGSDVAEFAHAGQVHSRLARMRRRVLGLVVRGARSACRLPTALTRAGRVRARVIGAR